MSGRKAKRSRPGVGSRKKKKDSSDLMMQLSKLSTSYGKHRANYHDRVDEGPNLLSQHESEIPLECKKGLSSMRKILPQVQAAFRAANEPSIEIVETICMIYQNVVTGEFCPQAPRLLSLGDGAKEVIECAHFLLEFVMLRSVVADTIFSCATIKDSKKSLFLTICTTVVELLSIVPQIYLQQDIICDLVELANDLATLRDAGIFKKPGSHTVTVALFRETVSESADPMAKYSLKITSQEALVKLQAATFSILRDFLIHSRDIRMNPESYDLPIPCDIRHSEVAPTSFVLYGFGILEDLEYLQALIASIRQAILNPCEGDHKVRALGILSKARALKLLILLVEDWHHQNAPSVEILAEVALLIAYATQEHLLVTVQEASHSESLKNLHLVDDLLAQLLDLAITVPPRVSGACIPVSSGAFVYQAIFLDLLSCVDKMKNIQKGDSGSDPTRRILEEAILRSLLSTVSHLSVPGTFRGATSDIFFPAVVEKLFRFLSTVDLHAISACIISEVLLSFHEIPFFDFNEICSRSASPTVSVLPSLLVEVPKSTNSLLSDQASPRSSRKRVSVSPALSNLEFVPSKRIKTSQESSGADLSPGVLSLVVAQEFIRFFDRLDLDLSRIAVVTAGEFYTAGASESLAVLWKATSALMIMGIYISRSKHCNTNTSIISRAKSILDAVERIAVAASSGSTDSVLKVGLVACRVAAALWGSHCENLWGLNSESVLKSETGTFLRQLCQDASDPDTLAFNKLSPISRLLQYYCSASCESAFLLNPTVLTIEDVSLLCSYAKTGSPYLRQFRVSSAANIRNGSSDEHMKRLKLLSSTAIDSSNLTRSTLDIVDTQKFLRSDHLKRILGWQSIYWLFSGSTPIDFNLQLNVSAVTGPSLVKGILALSLSEKDAFARDFMSRDFGRLFRPGTVFRILSALVDDPIAQSVLRESSPESLSGFSSASEHAVEEFFRLVDEALNKFCHVPKSQLPYTVSSSSDSKPRSEVFVAGGNAESMIPQRRIVARLLGSICENVNLETVTGRLLFHQALIRIVRLWSGYHHTFHTCARGVAFGEIARVLEFPGVRSFFMSRGLRQLIPNIFRDILIPSSSFQIDSDRTHSTIDLIQRKEQFQLLTVCLRDCFMKSLQSINTYWRPQRAKVTEEFVDEILPFVLADLIVQKDYDALKVATEYTLSVRTMKISEHKRMMRQSVSMVSNSENPDAKIGKNQETKTKSENLADELRRMCVAPSFYDTIMAVVMVKAGREEIKFLLKEVLQNRISFQASICLREQMFLKALFTEAGRYSEQIELGVRAVQLAAQVKAESQRDTSSTANFADGALPPQDAANDAVSLAEEWITSHFMYLLVNVVQHRWKYRTDSERSQALTSLCIMLRFLNPLEAAQLFPQILATVNTAISEFGSLEHRVLAAKALSMFVQIVAGSNWTALASHLTAVVVALIPLIMEATAPSQRGSLEREASCISVDLLCRLTQGALGGKLAPFFSEIPFLPLASTLDEVRASLKKLGVDFDNLEISATQGTQLSAYPPVSSTASDSASTAIDKMSTSLSRQAALRRRLKTVSGLLNNENTSIRKVSLEHVSALLKSNRLLFHSLIEHEAGSTLSRHQTVAYKGAKDFSGASVVKLLQLLVGRCITETDEDVRIALSACLGEVGAIGVNFLDWEDSKTDDFEEDTKSVQWRDTKPPWLSRPARYQLQLVTKHLGPSLLAAPTSKDQHKVAFTIQEILALLDKSARESENRNEKSSEMTEWLSLQLKEAGVLEVVKPYWSSEFFQRERFSPKEPPFFRTSNTYFSWISSWSGYMVYCTSKSVKSRWSETFVACSTCLRSPSGLDIAEFLLPLFILDRLCFGDTREENMMKKEINDALTFCPESDAYSRMNRSERHKAVSLIFSILDVFQSWLDMDTETRHRASRSRSGGTKRQKEIACIGDDWPQEQSTLRIEEFLSSSELPVRANAAIQVGMNARALQLLEFHSRKLVSQQVFDADSPEHRKHDRSRAAGSCPSQLMNDLKSVLFSLHDYETLKSVIEDDSRADPLTRARDSLLQREAICDWSGAMQDCELIQQLTSRRPDSQTSLVDSTRYLLELGQLEGVLSQSTNLNIENHSAKKSAVEAAWRLGRWEKLDLLVSKDSEDCYDANLGKIMLNLHKGNRCIAMQEIKHARLAVMDELSSAARESYLRSFVHVARLHSLREIEDFAISMLSSTNASNILEESAKNDWGWDRRLDFISSAESQHIINVRIALSRISKDTFYEGHLLVGVGKKARKGSRLNMANRAFSEAEALIHDLSTESRHFTLKAELLLELAELRHADGDHVAALRMLGMSDIESLFHFDDDELKKKAMQLVIDMVGVDEKAIGHDDALQVFARCAINSTEWMREGDLKGSAEIMTRFKIIHRIAPKWEKGHLQFARFIDSTLQARIHALRNPTLDAGGNNLSRESIVAGDRPCQSYILTALRHFTEALTLDVSNVYQALPRLLSLWFELTSIRQPERTNKDDSNDLLLRAQSDANTFMAKSYKTIQPRAFYTAMAQLISRVIHDDKETSVVVREILKRVLVKFPAQAMWPLAWLRHSKHKQRQKVGDSIFRDVERHLSAASHDTAFKLVAASKSLFRFLHDLAKYVVKDATLTSLNVKPWTGEVDLSEFVPPIQAALSVSLASGDSGKTRDLFPRDVPRMRTFDQRIGLMSSKARPKKLKAFLVPADIAPRLRSSRQGRSSTAARSQHDIGELHFLVKQEAKGDLRKDARVQDLNNVINRLMSSLDDSEGVRKHGRRFHLRTFSVICLSEETGLLEWVPHTESLRGLVTKAYNPQASEYSTRRRGRRLVNFTDPGLRNNFENKCQAMFYQNGDLKRAALMFEELCLKPYPPLLYWWFVQTFRDPHSWFEARTRFTLSAAIWSAVGHIIGLGDRHSENILVDTSTGECVHVDFDCIFDKGLNLPKPEVVPFRLTQNMVDAFGPTGADGIFKSSLQNAIEMLRNNRDTLLSVLEPFLKDPVIDWKRYRSQQRKDKQGTNEERQTREAKRSINVIDERLRGIYNLRNPNSQRISRTDGFVNPEDEELSHLLPLSVEGQVHKMIAEATSHENLVQLYVGWMPWV